MKKIYLAIIFIFILCLVGLFLGLKTRDITKDKGLCIHEVSDNFTENHTFTILEMSNRYLNLNGCVVLKESERKQINKLVYGK